MSSRLFYSIAALSLLSFIVGCSLVNDGEKRVPIELQSNETQCLSKWSETLAKYFDENTDRDDPLLKQELGEFWQCTYNVLDTFKKNVRGAEIGGYTALEMKSVLNQFVVSEKQITLELIHAILKFKRSLFGGRDDRLSHADIDNLIEAFHGFESVFEIISPHLNFLFLRKELDPEKKEQHAEYKAAMKALHEGLQELSRTVAKTESHDLLQEDVESLLFHAGSIFTEVGQENISESIHKYVPIFFYAKSLVNGLPEGRIAKEEWPSIFTGIERGLHVLYGTKTLLKAQDRVRGEGYIYFVNYTKRLLGDLKEITKRHSNQEISWKLWYKLLKEIQRLDILFPPMLMAETVIEFIQIFFEKSLSPRPGIPVKTLGMTVEHFEVLENSLMDWAASQWVLLHTVEKNRKYGVSELRQRLGDFSLTDRSWRGRFEGVTSLPLKAPTLNFIEHISKAHPPIWHDKNRLLISRKPKNQLQDRFSLIRMNWARSIVQLIMRGYVHEVDRQRSRIGVTQEELQEFYEDIFTLGVQLNALDLRVPKAGERIFLEANMFSPRGDGNQWADEFELVAVLSYINSIGGVANTLIYEDVKARCPHMGVGIFGQPAVSLKCFREVVRTQFTHYFKGMPELIEFLNRSEKVVWIEYMNLLEKSSLEHMDDGVVSLADIQAFVLIAQYSESLFARLDPDFSGVADQDEIAIGFPVLREFLASLLPIKSEAAVKTLYGYIIAKQEPPTEDLKGFSKILFYLLRDVENESEIDRVDMMRIFASIAESFKG